LADPANGSLFIGHDDPERAFALAQGFAIPTVGEQYDPIRECLVQLGQGKNDPVVVGGLDEQVGGKYVSPKLLTLLYASLLQYVSDQDPVKDGFTSILILDFHRPAGHA
jgi:hypothetical protein